MLCIRVVRLVELDLTEVEFSIRGALFCDQLGNLFVRRGRQEHLSILDGAQFGSTLSRVVGPRRLQCFGWCFVR